MCHLYQTNINSSGICSRLMSQIQTYHLNTCLLISKTLNNYRYFAFIWSKVGEQSNQKL